MCSRQESERQGKYPTIKKKHVAKSTNLMDIGAKTERNELAGDIVWKKKKKTGTCPSGVDP